MSRSLRLNQLVWEKKNKQTNDCILFENNIKIVSFFSLSGFTPQILFPFVTF